MHASKTQSRLHHTGGSPDLLRRIATYGGVTPSSALVEGDAALGVPRMAQLAIEAPHVATCPLSPGGRLIELPKTPFLPFPSPKSNPPPFSVEDSRNPPARIHDAPPRELRTADEGDELTRNLNLLQEVNRHYRDVG